MSPRDVLVKARKLLNAKKRWTKGCYVRRLASGPRYCLLGALGYRMGQIPPNAVLEARRALAAETKGPVDAWNDRPERTHAEVLALLDEAIAKAGES